MKTQTMNALMKAGFLAIALGFAMYAASPVHAETAAPHLTPVVQGDVWQGYGEANPLKPSPVRSRGVVYLTQPQAEVSAPATGIVEYAGKVDGMGQVVVINIGDDYRVVLTGLAQVAVEKGDIVEGHRRVGCMPQSGAEPAHLYMELRHGEEPVNPFAQDRTLVAMR